MKRYMHYNDGGLVEHPDGDYIHHDDPAIKALLEAIEPIRNAFPKADELHEYDDDAQSGRRRMTSTFVVTINDLRRLDAALAGLRGEA